MKPVATARTTALEKLAANPSAALFVGPRGSGKTLAAQGIAHTLGADLRRIDLRRLVSPNIRETEKAIDHLFDTAARDGAVLVFDEAEALFGKRTEVHNAHDRYANAETNYLLARIEDHRGAVIVTANSREALDPDIVRRLGAVIEFHPPTDPDQ